MFAEQRCGAFLIQFPAADPAADSRFSLASLLIFYPYILFSPQLSYWAGSLALFVFTLSPSPVMGVSSTQLSSPAYTPAVLGHVLQAGLQVDHVCLQP